MTAARRPRVSVLDAAVLREIESTRAVGEMELRTEPSCHVCCEAESKNLVNTLLSAGLTNREIVECCEYINQRREESEDTRLIGPSHVIRHRRHHFNVDAPAMAVYREIMERRAEEANRDFINGIGHAITPYALLETVMVKGYAHVTSEGSTVTVNEAISSATKLHELTRGDERHRKMADLLHQLDKIIAAAQEFVPPEMHEAFLARVEGRDLAPMQELVVQVHATANQAVREFTPSTIIDQDDEI